MIQCVERGGNVIDLKKANEEKLQTAKKLLQAGVSADIVASTLNLSMDEIKIH